MASRGRVAGAPRAALPHPPAPRREARSESWWRRWKGSAPARALRAHPHAAAAGLLALFVAALLWPALIGSEILSPMSIAYQNPPWAHLAPDDILEYYNPLLVDIPMADYPWRWLARELMHDGVFPAWNPHNFAGVPLFNNPQVGLFSPFNLPLWLLPLDYALGLSAAIKLWVGGFGAYLLVRTLGLGFLPGLLAGVSFAFCGLNIVWLTHETLPGVAVMLPWALLLVERLLAGDGRLGSVLALAAAIAVGLGGGHPGMQVHLMAAVGLYAVLRAATARQAAPGDRLRRLAWVGGGMLLGTVVMGIMLVPELLSSRGTLGTAARAGGRGSLPGTFMPFDTIRTTVVPDFWGRPSAFEVWATSNAQASVVNYNERTFYAGVVALLLALVALVSRGAWRRKLPFLVLAVIGLAIPLQAPGLHWLVTHLPAFELVQNQRIHFVYAMGVAVLGAFGLQALLDAPRERLALRLLAPLAAVAVAAVLYVSVDPGSAALDGLVDHFATGADHGAEIVVNAGTTVADVIALTSIAWLLLFTLGVGAALLAAWRWPRARVVIACAVVALAAADMYHFARGYQPMGPASRVIPPVTPAVRFLQARADDGRFVGQGAAMLPDYSLRFGLDDIRGYDPPQPTLRFYDLWRVANPAQENWRPFQIDQFTPAAVNVMSVLGARYVVTGPEVDLARGDGAGTFTRVYAGEDAAIFRNARAVPRVTIAPSILVAEGPFEVLATIASPRFDPRRAVIVERDARAATELTAPPYAQGSARIVDERNARVTIAADLSARGLVVLNDNLTDGWSVTVDGEEGDVVRVNGVLRGVVVPAGSHEIVWSYAVPGLRAGAALTALGLLAFAAGGAALVLRRRRRGQLAAASAAPR